MVDREYLPQGRDMTCPVKYGGRWYGGGEWKESWAGRQVTEWLLVESLLQTGCAAWANGIISLDLLINKISLLQLHSFFSLMGMGGGDYRDLREELGSRKGERKTPSPNQARVTLLPPSGCTE